MQTVARKDVMKMKNDSWMKLASVLSSVLILVVMFNLPACERDSCFAAGTLIDTPGGSVAIEELEVGDVVWSYDLVSGARVPARVTTTFQAEDQPMQRLVLGNGNELWVTSEHPFYVDGEWVEAGELTAGVELFYQEAGELQAIELRELASSSVRGTVYNIEVEGHHNFFAGGVLVHNKQPAVRDEDDDGFTACGDGAIPPNCDCDDSDPNVGNECYLDAGTDAGGEAP